MARILVVDDEPTNRLLAVTILRYGGHDVLEAESAAQAYERLANGLDLMLVDLFLPDVSGSELIGRIRRSKWAGLKIVLYTASIIDDAMRDFMEIYGIASVVAKPSEPGDLLATIESALRA